VWGRLRPARPQQGAAGPLRARNRAGKGRTSDAWAAADDVVAAGASPRPGLTGLTGMINGNGARPTWPGGPRRRPRGRGPRGLRGWTRLKPFGPALRRRQRLAYTRPLTITKIAARGDHFCAGKHACGGGCRSGSLLDITHLARFKNAPVPEGSDMLKLLYPPVYGEEASMSAKKRLDQAGSRPIPILYWAQEIAKRPQTKPLAKAVVRRFRRHGKSSSENPRKTSRRLRRPSINPRSGVLFVFRPTTIWMETADQSPTRCAAARRRGPSNHRR